MVRRARSTGESGAGSLLTPMLRIPTCHGSESFTPLGSPRLNSCRNSSAQVPSEQQRQQLSARQTLAAGAL